MICENIAIGRSFTSDNVGNIGCKIRHVNKINDIHSYKLARNEMSRALITENYVCTKRVQIRLFKLKLIAINYQFKIIFLNVISY